MIFATPKTSKRTSFAYLKVSMSKLIQSAYNSIESGKYKKAITILDSPELDRFPIAKV